MDIKTTYKIEMDGKTFLTETSFEINQEKFEALLKEIKTLVPVFQALLPGMRDALREAKGLVTLNLSQETKEQETDPEPESEPEVNQTS